MPIYTAEIAADLTWYFEVEAESEDAAYDKLWKKVGYEAEDIFDFEADEEYVEIALKVEK